MDLSLPFEVCYKLLKLLCFVYLGQVSQEFQALSFLNYAQLKKSITVAHDNMEEGLSSLCSVVETEISTRTSYCSCTNTTHTFMNARYLVKNSEVFGQLLR